jgi:hypothetical protein
MDQTSKLKLPYILAAQSQKHVTHNEALRVLDALVQLAVLDKDVSTPPGSPAEGDCYVVGATPTGAWAGHASQVAAFQDGAWAFHVPSEGWLAWVRDEDTLYAFDGTGWVPNSGGVNPVSLVGVNATADTTNRLSVASPASLFNHAGAGHQLKINKAAAGDTGSVLFQTAFSGRAEFGLAGDDDFHVKVSADGSAWHEALVFSRSNGTVKGAGIRERLVANRTYYVRTDGSDSNNGLANTSGGAFLTIQYALDQIVSRLDFGGYTVTVKVADGTYTAGLTMSGPWTGGGALIIEGNTTTKANCFIDLATNAVPFQISATLPGSLTIRGFRLRNAGTSNALIRHSGRGTVTISSIEFAGNASGGFSGQLRCDEAGARIIVASDIAITGGGSCWLQANSGGRIQFFGQTIVVTGTLAFSWMFAVATGISEIGVGVTFDISAATVTGTRYSVTQNSLINTSGGGASFFPGSVAGSTSTGGIYA